MSLWTRFRSRREPMVFTIELRRFFAARIIQNWWLHILKRRELRKNENIAFR